MRCVALEVDRRLVALTTEIELSWALHQVSGWDPGQWLSMKFKSCRTRGHLQPPTCGRGKGKLASAASVRRLRRP